MPKPRRRTSIFKKQRRIEVSVQKTVNLGNFESLKVQAGYSESIKEHADVEVAFNDAWNIVEYQIETAIQGHLTEEHKDVSKETISREQQTTRERLGVIERITISGNRLP